ncbi:MAG TPA: TrkA C-terminal domain-containing protein [Glaciihabitans sp.]|nr:TrkA C-terminal domain-containing protein [Glaciihabitans sp.]
MIDLLASSPILTLLLVVALGALVGSIPFGPLKFGAAGALFVGLAVGALDPQLGEGLALVQTLGLALFVYTVGLAAGGTFFRDLRRQLPLLGGAVVILAIAAVAVVSIGAIFGISSELRSGIFAGALTSTPALAAATAASGGSQEPAVGYALSYPVGVTITIIIVAFTLTRQWRANKDPQSAAGQGLIDISIEIDRATPMKSVPGFLEGTTRFSYLAREGKTRVVAADEEFQVGDHVVIIGPKEAVTEATNFLGHQVTRHLAQDRSAVDFRRFTVSDRRVAGRTVGELDIPGRFGGVVTRIRRGDLDLLASDDITIELGDRIRVVVPRKQIPAVSALFGDSDRKASEVDALTLGLGMVLGLLLGLIPVPLPGGGTFALGAAAGPLVVGLILGRIERTGPLVWGLPNSANLTIRQLGLLLFLAATGLASGQAFAAEAFSLLGPQIVSTAAIVVLVTAILFVVLARVVGVSPARAAGGLAGFVGQPAILAYANTRTTDERVDAGYAALFTLGIIVKIVIVQVIVGV